MLETLFQLFIFATKAAILVALILILAIGIVAILSRGKERSERGQISIRNLNKKYHALQEHFLHEMLPKKAFKLFLKDKKAKEKELHKKNESEFKQNIFVINFEGDIKGSAVNSLREEVTAILGVAKPQDEVFIKIDSGGGLVNAYGLAAAQITRIRELKIPVTVSIDKVAASGGYLMASVANQIIAAPFAIIGSIGVIVQIPNFHKLLKEKNIDFEQLTAGQYKRTLTLFGENTEEGREKLREEIEEIHHLFKDLIVEHRPMVDVNKVATGEHWLAKQAIGLNLLDKLETSDDYLFKASQRANIYEVCYKTKKSIREKLFSNANIFSKNHHHMLY